MQCTCGYILPAEVAYCPNCGHPTTYDNSTVAPTQKASGVQPPLAPTQVAAEAPGGAWQAPPPPDPGMGQSGPGWPSAPMIPLAPAPVFVPAPQQRSGCSTAAIVISAVLFVVVCGGLILGGGVWYSQAQQANASMTAIVSNTNATATGAANDAAATSTDATATSADATAVAQLTPTPYPPYNESQPPSGATFSGLAQQILPTAQMASQLNSQYQPTELESVFSPGQEMYLAYHWVNVGYAGYAYTIWYFNGQNIGQVRSSYMSTAYSYYNSSFFWRGDRDGQGAVEVYWCSKSDCSDRQLAWVRPFTISG